MHRWPDFDYLQKSAYLLRCAVCLHAHLFTNIVLSLDKQAVCLQRTRNKVWWSACFKLDQQTAWSQRVNQIGCFAGCVKPWQLARLGDSSDRQRPTESHV